MKIDYKNCTSRWSLTHCNMMHGTHNVKPNRSAVLSTRVATYLAQYYTLVVELHATHRIGLHTGDFNKH